MKTGKRVVIANASGFWGDEADAVARQVRGGRIDYLTMDYLAEITMIILARQQGRNPATGYAGDFVPAMAGVLSDIAEKGITVITNAGGMNPQGCAAALEKVMADQGIELPVAVVDGDDLMPRLPALAEAGCRFEHQETGEAIGDRIGAVKAANAYIGARPIVAALEKGARIVVTGRCYDAASVVAPLVYEFGWDWTDFDRMAAALLAGHLIECGAQSTGGNFTLWKEVASYRNMGYPIVEVGSDGAFVLTKHPGTGGLVSTATVKEQLLYEIHDPRTYFSPDVIADFTSARLEDAGENRVRVHGVTGQKPTGSLKVSMAFDAGYKVVQRLVISGPDAVEKARTFAKIFWDRAGHKDLIEHRTDFVGHSACWGESASPPCAPNDLILRLAARAATPGPLERMSRQVSGLILAGPPGVTVFGGRAKITPAFGFWPALIPREKVSARVKTKDREEWIDCARGPAGPPALPPSEEMPDAGTRAETVRVPLRQVAHARSGDKGDTVNIGLAALRPEFYPELIREVTPKRVGELFRSNVHGPVERFPMENISAMNFVLHGALDGGGTVSLLADNQGKTLSQALLNLTVEIRRDLLPSQTANQGAGHG